MMRVYFVEVIAALVFFGGCLFFPGSMQASDYELRLILTLTLALALCLVWTCRDCVSDFLCVLY